MDGAGKKPGRSCNPDVIKDMEVCRRLWLVKVQGQGGEM